MIRIGLTGTVGAGKSTVADLFERWGARRVDADELAREAVEPGGAALAAIREEWGDEVLDEEGRLDREEMRRRVFGDADARRRLEEIVHPEVRRLRDERMTEAREAGADVVVSEVPLLLEKEMEEEFDVVVVVDAPRSVRRRRVAEERGVDAETFGAIEAAQWPADRKRRAADRVIDNGGSLADLEQAARRVWERIVGEGGGA